MNISTDAEKPFDKIPLLGKALGEAPPLQSGCADPCDLPKHRKLPCDSEGLRSRSPRPK